MNTSLKYYLTQRGYHHIPLNLTRTNHFEIKALVNDIEGSFIVDTGASSTCIGLDWAAFFQLQTESSELRAAGAGATDMLTQLSRRNRLKIGQWELPKVKIILFDLTHVNTALVQHQSSPVHGIIGADILKRGRAIIDYHKKILYLKD